MARLGKFDTGAKTPTPTVVTKTTVVKNFMGGSSHTLTPLNTLRIIAASSIFGEPTFYREAGVKTALPTIKNYSSISSNSYLKSAYSTSSMSAAQVFTNAIDRALDADFKGTLEFAQELREDYFMRLNPAIIYVRASIHKNRAAFNEANPGFMKSIGKAIAMRPDDLTNQFEYYCYLFGGKAKLSSIMKRTWSERLQEFSRYQLNKYKGKKLIDLVRISHASSTNINELMTTGTLEMADENKTWETLRSAGNSWLSILHTLDVPHMALLRNLRGIFQEVADATAATEVINKLVAGVEKGKQFPFRYYSAYTAIKNDATVKFKAQLLAGLETCLEAAISNMPTLKGKTISLSDNSGSAWGSVTSEYGTTHVAEIANLSSLITSYNSEEGYVGVFGDNLSVKATSDRKGLLKQLEETCTRGKAQGGGTENGIWLFWNKAINNKEHWDTVFIYSDMQAGHGGLYGTTPSDYRQYAWKGSRNIDVLALVQKYRDIVNPKVNVFSVQVAGYDNTVLPEDLYRGAVLTGWTGKEPIYADALIKAWDTIEGLRAPWFSTRKPAGVEKAVKARLDLSATTKSGKTKTPVKVVKNGVYGTTASKKFSLDKLMI